VMIQMNCFTEFVRYAMSQTQDECWGGQHWRYKRGANSTVTL